MADECYKVLLWVVVLSTVFSGLAYAQEFEIKGYVNDYAGVISAAEEAELSAILSGLDKSGKAQAAVVTLNSLNGRDIEGFSYELAEGVLGDKEKNNGLLLVVAVEDRLYRFEVGRGLEPIIPDVAASRIARDYLVPDFRNQEYGRGIINAFTRIDDMIEQGEPYAEQDLDREYNGYIIMVIVFIAALAIIFAAVKSSNTPKNNKRQRDAEDFFTAAYLAGMMFRNSGRRGGGSGGGGFGGFGGGSFGGGGASGGR